MSTTYRTVAGDTFAKISRKVTGTEASALKIARANPDVSEPLAAGLTLNIPTRPSIQPTSAPAANVDEVAVLVNGQRFRYWSRVAINRGIDTFDTIELSAPFDHTASGFKEAFRPFAFNDLQVLVGGSPLFTGTIVSVNPVVDVNSRTVSISGYALPGVLNDCTLPVSVSLEFNNAALNDIVGTIAEPFGLPVEFRASPGAAFERVASAIGKKILPFLIDLAQQRGLLIASSEGGAILFWQSVEPGNPIARLRQGAGPLLSVNTVFSPQEYYSSITGIEAPLVGLPGAQYVETNPHLTNVLRPVVFEIPDKSGAEAVTAKSGRMFGNAIQYTVEVADWRAPGGALWAPNTTIKLTAPDAMIYNEYEFLITSVRFERSVTAATATLTLTVPGAFSGQIPGALPWDE